MKLYGGWSGPVARAAQEAHSPHGGTRPFGALVLFIKPTLWPPVPHTSFFHQTSTCLTQLNFANLAFSVAIICHRTGITRNHLLPYRDHWKSSVTVQGLLEIKETHRPWDGPPMLLGLALQGYLTNKNTRSTTLSSKVNLPHAIHFGDNHGANSVTLR